MALVPYVLPISGNFDGNGMVNTQIYPSQDKWAAYTVSVVESDLSARPSWLLSASGSPLLTADGSKASMGPVPVPPNTRLDLSAVGGNINDSWRGTIWGVYSDTGDPKDIGTIYQAQSSVFSQRSMARINIFATIVAAAAGGQNQVVVSDASQYIVGDPLFLITSTFTTGNNIIGAIAHNPDGTWTITFLANIFGPANPGDRVNLAPSIRVDPSNTVGVVQNNNPPPWLRPNGVQNFVATIAAGGTLGIVTGVAGLFVYVHQFGLAFDAVAATTLQLREAGGGQIFGEFDASPPNVYWALDGKGKQTAAGKGLELFNAGANACLPVGVAYFSGPTN